MLNSLHRIHAINFSEWQHIIWTCFCTFSYFGRFFIAKTVSFLCMWKFDKVLPYSFIAMKEVLTKILDIQRWHLNGHLTSYVFFIRNVLLVICFPFQSMNFVICSFGSKISHKLLLKWNNTLTKPLLEMYSCTFKSLLSKPKGSYIK